MNGETSSATAAIRAALWARRSDLAGIARDCGVSAESLHAFLGGSNLAPEILGKMTTRFFGGAFRFDEASDAMVHAMARPPTTVPTLPRTPVARGKVPTNDEILEKMRNKSPAPKQAPVKPSWLRG